ncbi:venom peptide SjAPI-like [Uranotaenia lowii]|uniref:venom peptide SjAPI-like n=1 Tax=Uranotaenia lowii TaxID=190385 RepID=UPI00247869E0|nr:venom peptide SjAPI-like [Uranotaenia lowii]
MKIAILFAVLFAYCAVAVSGGPESRHATGNCNQNEEWFPNGCEDAPLNCQNYKNPSTLKYGGCHGGCLCKAGYVRPVRNSEHCILPQDCQDS